MANTTTLPPAGGLRPLATNGSDAVVRSKSSWRGPRSVHWSEQLSCSSSSLLFPRRLPNRTPSQLCSTAHRP